MKKAAPAIPLFGDAYLADTRHLTLEEHGAYLQLLMIAWRTDGCCLPADDARLARMLGVTGKKWGKLKPEVMAFWECRGESWFHAARCTQPEQRKAIAAAVRLEVAQRDGGKCAYCGASEGLQLDHIVPWSRGGSDDASNLTLACQPCNNSKSDRTPEEWLQ